MGTILPFRFELLVLDCICKEWHGLLLALLHLIWLVEKVGTSSTVTDWELLLWRNVGWISNGVRLFCELLVCSFSRSQLSTIFAELSSLLARCWRTVIVLLFVLFSENLASSNRFLTLGGWCWGFLASYAWGGISFCISSCYGTVCNNRAICRDFFSIVRAFIWVKVGCSSVVEKSNRSNSSLNLVFFRFRTVGLVFLQVKFACAINCNPKFLLILNAWI